MRGCGAPTNEGDFLRIAAALGAKLGNLHNVYRNEGILRARRSPTPSPTTASGSTRVTRCWSSTAQGKRFVNERRNYQDRNMAHLDWDPNDGTWPNLLGYLVYDQRVAENWAGNFPYPALDAEAPFVITADTLEELGAAIRERVESLPSVTVGMGLTDDIRDQPDRRSSEVQRIRRRPARTRTSSVANSATTRAGRPRRQRREPTVTEWPSRRPEAQVDVPARGDRPVLRDHRGRLRGGHQRWPGHQQQRPGADRTTARRSRGCTAPATVSPPRASMRTGSAA